MNAQELKKLGFKTHKDFREIYVNESGKVYHLKKQKFIIPLIKDKPYILHKGKYINVPKLVLLVFKKQRIRKGQILFIDRDLNNFHKDNVKYVRLFPNGYKVNLKKEDLYKAIRCYIPISESFVLENLTLKTLYIRRILKERLFYSHHQNKEHIEVFRTYVEHDICKLSNLNETAEIHGITARDVNVIINTFFNLLSSEILDDLSKGKLNVLPFTPKPLTETQKAKELNKDLIARGLKPIRLRKKSDKELFKDFKRHCEEVKSTKRV
ncbi:hypothetical protein [Flammeovirga sp. EKP202]|uniref:hypothetical protein n=1 Tax=Flammeovirga sp. EKP202 TaxID=2770592 RepID=UPI00165F94DC|nr:hypothetical protein [Flammeovirga sp. EKP202]MBD0402913.1 hypothetical protein [Flammeovirga sp. EKP202]